MKLESVDNVEAALVGAMLSLPNGDLQLQIARRVQVDDLFLERHRIIWGVVLSLVQELGCASYQLVIQRLADRGVLELAGGPAYLTQCLAMVDTLYNAPVYAELVKRAAFRRRLLEALTKAHGVVRDEGLNAREVRDRVLEIVRKAAMSLDLDPSPTWEELVLAVRDTAESMEERILPGIPTPWQSINNVIGGLMPHTLVIIGGVTSVGKTAFMCCMALEASRHKVGVLYISKEQSAQAIATRMVAIERGISLHRLRMGRLTQEEWQRLYAGGLNNLKARHITAHSVRGLFTPDEVRARIDNASHKVDVVFVDHLHLMRHVGFERVNRTQELGAIIEELQSVCADYNIPVVVASQLSRNVDHREDNKPTLSDLAWAGAIEQAADCVMLLHRPGKYETVMHPTALQPAQVIIAKNRDGPLAEINMLFSPETARYIEA
jgi:replicative DNA helicase